MPVIYVIAEIRINPGTIDKALSAARACIAETVKENGCISYDLHQSVSDPLRLVFVERWTSRDALSRHLETPHLKAWRAVGAEIVAERKVEVITPEAVTGL
jgi:quinol monooxygenase YgiN